MAVPQSATDAALRAWERRPARMEALADLARHFREQGMNQTATMFARRGLKCPWPTDDLLFVEANARESLATDLAICGYYCDPESREAARRACEGLALGRDVSRETRDHARNVLFWHAPKLRDLAPSWRASRLEGFTAPANWHAMNPSVARLGDRVMMNIRCVNYWIEPDGSYQFPHTEPAVMTRNFLAEVNPAAPHRVVGGAVEIVPDLGWMAWGDVRGMEDVRLFAVGEQLWFSAACRQMNDAGLCEQLIGRLGLDGSVHGLRPMRLNTGLYEKNWMPVVTDGDQDPIRFVYRVDPTVVVRPDMEALSSGEPTWIAADNFSGSSQLVPFDGGWLAMTHEPLSSPINGRRLNQQRFVLFDGDLRLDGVSDRCIFELNEEIEYVVGLCQAPNGGRLIISYGSHDRQAWVGTIDADDVRRMLHRRERKSQSVGEIAGPQHATHRPVSELLPSWRGRRLAFTPPDGFAAKSPSVLNYRGRLLASVRCINYAPNDEAGYHRITDGAAVGDYKPVSRTFLLEFDPETLLDSILGELNLPQYLTAPRADPPAYGFEDIRLFEWGGDLWGIAAFSEQSIDGLAEQWVVRISGSTILSDARHVVPHEMPRRAEKNWMPLIGLPEPRFIYLCDPTTVIDAWGHVVSRHPSEIAAEHFHGGSQAIPFEGGWLAIVHWQQVFDETNRWVDFEYRNRFIWLDGDFKLKRVSPAWEFPIDPAIPSFPRRFQIVHGLAWHPNGERLIVGYDLHEREPWVATVDAADVRKILSLQTRVSDMPTQTSGQSQRFPYIAHARRLGGIVFDLWITDPVAEAWYKEIVVEPDKLWCLEHLRSGMTVVDCGAHHGQTTVAFAKAVGFAGRVIAFEALAANASVIDRNLSLNGCENVEVHPHALGADEGVATFAHNGGNGHRAHAGETVSVLPLDQTAAGRVDRVDFIKIDVEGCEVDVLRGARGVLGRHQPLMDIEVHNTLVADAARNIDDLLDELALYDYNYSSPNWNGSTSLKSHLLATGAHLFCEPRGGGTEREKMTAARAEDEWVLGQTNRPLGSEADVIYAIRALDRLGLPHHINPPRKDWDNYLAIHHCVATTGKDALVLDAGGAHGSAFLPGLHRLGYSHLMNLDIDEVSPGVVDGIEYRRGDITASGLPDGSVEFVLCQSVLEHGVDWRAFFREMARIVSSGGNLFVSVDYWEPAIHSRATIFSAADIVKMLSYAEAFGFECSGEPSYDCRDSWPWGGQNYTFFNFLLKKGNVIVGEPVSRHETVTGIWWLSERAGDVIARELIADRRYDPEIVDEALRHIRSGTDVLDLGANVGAMAIPFARAAHGGTVHAFEAEPFVATMLRRNAVENDVNVRVYDGAVWHTGGLDLAIAHPDYGSAGNWGWGNCEVDPTLNSGCRVPSIAVDQLGLIDPISFMKVDVQGSDLFAMRGAKETIMRHRMPILFEFEPSAQEKFATSWADYEHFIEEIGYSISTVIYGANYLILPR